MKTLAKWAFIGLIVIVQAVYLPMIYEKIFVPGVEKTHLLFSPIIKAFVYKEKIVGPIPAEAHVKAEDHHSEIAYRDETGRYYSRVEFEKRLPFIYYKNMALWGLLPLELEGRSFDEAAIKEHRQVLELKVTEIRGLHPEVPVYPLLESNPGSARLVFPEDRYRLDRDGLTFINADTARVDPELSRRFTTALGDAGFKFPARMAAGKHSILKPFDEGAFLMDDQGAVFHLKRRNGTPVVKKTSIGKDIQVRHIKISENRRREYYGLVLGQDDSLYLMGYGDHGLIKLPLENYDPDRMDFKLLINPLYQTAVYSDEATIYGVVMDQDFKAVHRYRHAMSRGAWTGVRLARDVLFPFRLRLAGERKGYMQLGFKGGGWWSLIGIGCCLLFYGVSRFRMPGARIRPEGLCLIALTGLYGLVAGLVILDE